MTKTTMFAGPFGDAGSRVVIDREYVESNLGELVRDQDLSRYIL